MSKKVVAELLQDDLPRYDHNYEFSRRLGELLGNGDLTLSEYYEYFSKYTPIAFGILKGHTLKDLDLFTLYDALGKDVFQSKLFYYIDDDHFWEGLTLEDYLKHKDWVIDNTLYGLCLLDVNVDPLIIEDLFKYLPDYLAHEESVNALIDSNTLSYETSFMPIKAKYIKYLTKEVYNLYKTKVYCYLRLSTEDYLNLDRKNLTNYLNLDDSLIEILPLMLYSYKLNMFDVLNVFKSSLYYKASNKVADDDLHNLVIAYRSLKNNEYYFGTHKGLIKLNSIEDLGKYQDYLDANKLSKDDILEEGDLNLPWYKGANNRCKKVVDVLFAEDALPDDWFHSTVEF